jgi:hypothetical protein
LQQRHDETRVNSEENSVTSIFQFSPLSFDTQLHTHRHIA